MKEYELYVPLHSNDGRPLEGEKIEQLKRQLTDEFGGLTHFPQENEGLWKIGRATFRDKIVILRVLSADDSRAEQFFAKLKETLRHDWQQEDVLIVVRPVTVV